jgi:predicted DCC family thiol-disulfide oxidoreductase YuxK
MRNRIEQPDAFMFGLGRTQLFLTLCLVSLGLWIAFAKLAVPPLIESAYRGESYSFLNGIIVGQAEEPVEFYLQLWNRVTTTALVAGLAFFVLSWLITSKTFFRKFVGEATPGTLGAIRMWTCAILLMITVWDDLGSLALLPPEYRMDMGLMKVFHSGPLGPLFGSFLASETALRLFQRVTEIVLFLGVIGWQTRIVIPLATLLSFVFNGILREYTGFWHQGLVPLYVLGILSFTPCGDGFSVDRLRRLFKGQTVQDSATASAVYGWARYVCWTAIALTYSAAGLSKLRGSGLEWMSASSMKGLLFEQTLYPRASNLSLSLHLVSAPDIVFVLLAITALCGEVFFAAVLFSRVARRILPGTIILMHVGIILLQNIVFFDFMLLLLIFYDFTAITRKLGTWLSRRNPVQALYDGMCPLCRRTVRVLGAMDLFRAVEFIDFRSLNLAEYNQKHALKLTADALEKEMILISHGRSHGGFEGFRVIALRVPALWPVVPFLFLPGVSKLGGAAYGHVAHNRLALVKCESDCAVDKPASETAKDPLRNKSARYVFAYGTGIAVLVTLLGTFWALSLEYYPFTDMHMFSGVKKSATYYKVYGHFSSGEVSSFRLEDTLPAMSLNSRYEPLFYLCFGPADQVSICKKTLTVLTSAYNKKAAPGKRLTDLEIQRWKWDYISNPNDPNYGNLDARFVAGLSGAESNQRNPQAAAARN